MAEVSAKITIQFIQSQLEFEVEIIIPWSEQSSSRSLQYLSCKRNEQHSKY